MSRSVISRSSAVVVLALLGLGLTSSADPKDDPDGKKEPVVKRPTKLVILVEARAEHTPEKVMKTLKTGAEKSGCRYEGKPEIRATPAAFFRLLRGFDGQPETDDTKGKEKVTMRPSLDEPSNWLVRVNEPADGRLVKLKVKYLVAGGTEKTQTYEPKNPEKFPTMPLLQTMPRSYVLVQGNDKAVTREDLPASFEAEVVRSSAPDDKPEVVSGTVDTGPRYFMVTFTNFEGELASLFETIKDKDKVGNPVADAKADEELAVVFASWHRKLPGGEWFQGYVYRPSYTRLERRRVVRVWIRFPLTKEMAEKELEEYRKFDETKLVARVREDKPERGNAPLTVGASTKPRWIELPDASGGKLDYFSRDIKMQNFDDLQRDYPDAHQLVVYEFEPAEAAAEAGVEAIEVPDPTTKKGVYVFAQPINGWMARLDRLRLDEKSKPAPVKDKDK